MIDFKKIRRGFSHIRAKKLPDDMFINLLRSLVTGEGMLHVGNPYLIDYALKNMPNNGCVVEIGSYGGLSTSLILHLLKKNNRTEKLFNCDPWIYGGVKDTYTESCMIDGSDTITCSSFAEYMKNNFMRSMKFLNAENLPHSFHLTSDAFFEKYEQKIKIKDLFERDIQLGDPISFAYIDGDHSYEYAKRDFENVNKHLVKSGFVLFDDSIDGSHFGSALFMKEMKKNKNYKFVSKNPNYLFQKIV